MGEPAEATAAEATESKAQTAKKEDKLNDRTAKKQSKLAASDVNSVDLIVEHVMKKYGSMDKAEKCFNKLHDSVGQMSFLGRAFTEEEITEAWIRVTGEFEERDNALNKDGAEANDGADTKDGADVADMEVDSGKSNVEFL